MKEVPVFSPAVKQLLSLVRASLWQTPVECLPFNARHIDWDEIGKLSVQQTVGALAFNAAMRLPQELLPPKGWIRKAYSFIVCNKQTQMLLDSCVADASARLTATGIRPILLKGQAYARVYPEPGLRQCGDIDLYVGEEQYFPAYQATKNFGWKSEERFIPYGKHYGCFNKEVRIELHRIAATLPSRSANRRFQEWSRQLLQQGHDTILIGEQQIEVPPPVFNLIYVFLHMYMHFLNGGIGLRHVCDWTMLLHAHYKAYDMAELEKLLKEFHLLNGWRFFTPIAVRYLGLPEQECPLYSPECINKADRILTLIMKEGNFGRARKKKTERPKNYLAGKVYSLLQVTSRSYSRVLLDPAMTLRYYINFVRIGSKAVIMDLFADR